MATGGVPIRRDRRTVLQEFCTLLENNSDLLLSGVELDSTVISNGTFVVKSATLYNTEFVAAKALRRDYLSVERFVTECKFVLHHILKNTVHPNVLRMYGFADRFGECPHLIMEYMSRPLSEFIQLNKRYKGDYYNSELKLHIARDVASGLNSKYLHSSVPVYVHCSLTCDNILLTEGNRAKISNFSRVRVENVDDLPEPCNELRSYLPYEVLGGASNVSRRCVDMYAYGKVVYYIATDTVPSIEEPEIGFDEELIAELRTRDDNHRCLYSVAFERIFNKTNPENRISADGAFTSLCDEIGPFVRPQMNSFKPVVKSVFSDSLYCNTSGHGSGHSGVIQIPPYLRNQMLTDNQLVKIAFDYVYKWETLAAALELTDIEVELIRQDHSAPMDRKLAMLRKWQQKFYPNDTVERLLTAYFIVRRNSDARKILQMLETDHRNSIVGSDLEDSQSSKGASSLGQILEVDSYPGVPVGGRDTSQRDVPEIEALSQSDSDQEPPHDHVHLPLPGPLPQENRDRGWRKRLSDFMTFNIPWGRRNRYEHENVSSGGQDIGPSVKGAVATRDPASMREENPPLMSLIHKVLGTLEKQSTESERELQYSQEREYTEIQLLQTQLQELEKQLKQHQHDKKQETNEKKETGNYMYKEDISSLALPGIQLVSREKLTIERSDKLQTLEWKNHGLKLHFPSGVLSDTVDSCDVDVASGFSGSFIFPEHHTLVSPVFYIQPTTMLRKPVTIEIEHCSSIESENDSKSLVPIFAHSSSRKPPYVFQPLEGGTFTPGSFWGSFEVSTFSCFCLSWFSNKEPPAVYSGRMYYRSVDSNQWFTVKLIVFPNLMECHEAVEKRYTEEKKWILMRSSFTIRFLDRCNVLSVLIDELGVVKEGWEITPGCVPLQISKDDIHNPKVMEYYDVANCELTVMWTKDEEKPQYLKHYIDLQGVNIEKLQVTLNPNEGLSQTATVNGPLALETRKKFRNMGVTHLDLRQLVNELRPLPADKIHELGTQLRVPDHKIKEFEHCYPHNSERVKSEIIKYWLDNAEDCSWDDIAEALDEIGFKNIARKLRDA